jgi:hypothetical protein
MMAANEVTTGGLIKRWHLNDENDVWRCALDMFEDYNLSATAFLRPTVPADNQVMQKAIQIDIPDKPQNPVQAHIGYTVIIIADAVSTVDAGPAAEIAAKYPS